ncbi:MAG: response regulator, partial [Bacteroidales bacterium]|nr:response regulator [Bacteroidales bacterium]
DITERKRAEQIQKVLYNISNAVITTDNLEKLIGLIQKELGTVIDTTNFYVALYDHKNDTLSVPFFADEKNEFTTFPAGKTLTYYIIKTQEPLFATKEILKKLEKSGDIESFGTDSEIWLGVPLKIEGEVTGVLAVQSYSDENAFNESDMKMLEFVSDHISISIDRKKTEEELIKSKEKAEENDRLKTAFLTNMSHEIRTPMNGIIGFADLLKKANYIDKKEFDFYANIIVDSSKQLLNIVNDILDISKIETGQIDLYEEEVALNSILNDILSFFEIKAKEKGLSLNLITDLSIVNPIILVDISKLKQIIFNVIGNAFKFTEKGSIDFGYKIKGSQLEFFVKDSGIGIPKKYHKDIFNRFNKVENDSTQLFGGTGLGLAICTGLVEKMGGRIWVESDPDSLSGSQGKTGGAEFYFTIPYYKTSTQTKVSKLQGNITESNLADFTILVVEDEKNSASYLKEILSNRKIKQLLAKDGKQAIEIFKKNSDIDLILMDIKLPVMDGYAATREIKKINSEIPVIAQTAYAMLGDKEKSLKAGCDDYISKPISEENLISLLEKYLKK